MGSFVRMLVAAALGLLLVSATGLAQDRFFDSNGVRIRFVEQGSGDAIVLVHGSGSTLESWLNAGVLSNLAKDYHVIALDARGHGKSGKPHEVQAYGREMGLDVVRLLDHLGIRRAHIVGYSMGSNITAQLLTTHAERFLTATLGGAPGRFRWTDAQAADAEQEALERERECVSRNQIYRQAPTNGPKPDEEEIKRRSAACMADPNQDRFAMAALARARKDEVITPAQVSAVKVPTLGVVGSLDAFLADFQELKQLRPDVRLVVIEGATHGGERLAMRRPEFVAAVREFIASNGAPSRTSFSRAADACGTGLALGDTARFVGTYRNYSSRGIHGEMRIWMDTVNRIRFSESFQSGTANTVWDGELDVSDGAAPQHFVWRSRVDNVRRNTQTAERVGDSVIVTTGEQRKAEYLPTGALRLPPYIPAPAFAVLMQCALARGEKGLLTSQFGVVRLRKATTVQLRAAARTKTVSLYAATSDSVPDLLHLWLDDKHRVFASPSADIGYAVPVEWASSVEQLIVAEATAAEPRMRQTAESHYVRPAAGVVFVHARVVDVEKGTSSENVSVVVRGSRIVAIGPDSTTKAPVGAKIVDAAGKTLMPGLWDMNPGYMTDSWGAIYDDATRARLSRGVTSVYDIHGDTVFSPLIVRRLADYQQVGPRMFTTCSAFGWALDTIDGGSLEVS